MDSAILNDRLLSNNKIQAVVLLFLFIYHT